MKKNKKNEKKEAKLSFRPAGDRVLVKPDAAEDTKSPGGIIIPDTAKEKPERGVVASVGPGKRTDKGDVVPVAYKVGDKVMFSRYGFDEIKVDGNEYYIVPEASILGTFK